MVYLFRGEQDQSRRGNFMLPFERHLVWVIGVSLVVLCVAIYVIIV